MIKSFPSAEQIELFLKVHGKRGSLILSMLGSNRKFIEAVSSNIGQELLKDVMATMDLLIKKVLDETASDEDKSMYRAYRNIFNKWVDRIAKYNKHITKIKEG